MLQQLQLEYPHSPVGPICDVSRWVPALLHIPEPILQNRNLGGSTVVQLKCRWTRQVSNFDRIGKTEGCQTYLVSHVYYIYIITYNYICTNIGFPWDCECAAAIMQLVACRIPLGTILDLFICAIMQQAVSMYIGIYWLWSSHHH